MRRILLVLLLVVLAAAGYVAYLAVGASRLASRQPPAERVALLDTLPGAVERLAGAVRIPTVSTGDTSAAAVARNDSAFAALHAYLQRSFPRVHATLRREAAGRHAVLYTWDGTDAALPPLVLMGHLDVVPVESATVARWTHPPFGGDVADGFVWGRGTMDDKGAAVAELEAIETLLAQGHRPRRTVHVALGDDEEVTGTGAPAIVALFRQRGVRPALVVDEGGAVTRGLVPGVSRPVALVGAAEKGYASVEIVVRGTGGHSSQPPRHTAAGRLAEIVTRLEAHPFPARTGGASSLLFDQLAPDMSLGYRTLFANRRVFGPLLTRVLAASPTTDATQRTTTAVTMLEASPKDNVLPTRARAVVNFRLMPGDRVADVVAHVRDAVADTAVAVRVLSAVEASPVSSVRSPEWAQLARTVRQVWPDALVSPYLVVGATDARHWSGASDNVYRFAPMTATAADLARMHGTNERLAVADYAAAVRFYAQLVRNMER